MNCVGYGHELFVPTAVSRLVASDQQDADTAGIESIENAIRTALMLDTQLSHIRESGAANGIGMGRVSAGPNSSRT